MSVFESETSTFHVFNPQVQTQPQTQTQLQTYMQETAVEENAPVGRQNSILSLTLDEIQMKSGKSVGAMNMDEFLANLWTTVEDNDNGGGGVHNDGEKPTVLPRQGSLSVPVPLCKKTVDEVWFEIQNGVQQQQPPSSTSGQNSDEGIHRQRTLGEITLEDFLVKAGVVQEPLKTTMRMASSDLGYNPEFGVGLHCQTQNNYGENRSLYNENRSFYSVLGESSHSMTGNGRSNQYLTGLDAFRIKKRIIDGPPEILMERRQRRMIKNRESAARSRARRQAYTVELELELNQLTEENMKLKTIVEENEKKRRQEVMNRSTQITKEKNGDKLRRIRRMASAGW
ncbi:ABSCISIC ACID-INSENSITIVE 5-like protein 1 [Eutrema salsugineum]|uniref:ABSCISIC ACID-INSENSITIVE 5-like protein 1 n=1 Tax=Eutrema salsugineum TaxID=72664 RepID=UPI000CED193E|nr:ABSCISIC ACID-INSENSITIVE 5-like protein 1 [Eutrema salsugineum]XP_024013724.1 ABSCISIC ACID-INSENSITIVE 5-like protein 1 [Eutrema salsugineum]